MCCIVTQSNLCICTVVLTDVCISFRTSSRHYLAMRSSSKMFTFGPVLEVLRSLYNKETTVEVMFWIKTNAFITLIEITGPWLHESNPLLWKPWYFASLKGNGCRYLTYKVAIQIFNRGRSNSHLKRFLFSQGKDNQIILIARKRAYSVNQSKGPETLLKSSTI